jgi:hypothetical protein
MKTYDRTQTSQPITRNLWLAAPLAACQFAFNNMRLALAWMVYLTISSLLVIIFSSSFMSHASAAEGNGAVKIDFVAEEALAPIGPPGRIWVSDDGVQHIRDLPVAGVVWGDINGALIIVSNRNLDLATGDGTAYGTAVLEVEWNGLIGTFEGRSQWKIEGFRIVAGQFIGHGTGDFEGMQMQANFFNTDAGNPLIGTILIPQGD